LPIRMSARHSSRPASTSTLTFRITLTLTHPDSSLSHPPHAEARLTPRDARPGATPSPIHRITRFSCTNIHSKFLFSAQPSDEWGAFLRGLLCRPLWQMAGIAKLPPQGPPQTH
jgi:hypothetical protein